MCLSEDEVNSLPAIEVAGTSATGDERAFKLIVAYDGTRYFGWQRQPVQPTVQKAVELALGKVLGQPRWPVRATSRTDTGVHALGQVVVFRTAIWRAPAERLAPAMNTVLPADIVVRSACEVPVGFNPHAMCTGKRYRYRVYASRIADPLDGRFHWWVKRKLNVAAMQEAAKLLLGKHDFVAFETNGSPRQCTVRNVRAIDIQCRQHLDGQQIEFEIEADGFLYNMVRNIVGTLVVVGRERRSPNWVLDVLASKDRREAGQTAQPQGLQLLEVYFADPSQTVDTPRANDDASTAIIEWE
jgi:tRNA pseudouridine38-40 synthase